MVNTAATGHTQLRRLVHELVAELAPTLRAAGSTQSHSVAEPPRREMQRGPVLTATAPTQAKTPPAPTAAPSMPPSPSASSPPQPSGSPQEVLVSVSTDSELAALIARIQRLCDDPAARKELSAGRIRFRLSAEPTALVTPAAAVSARRRLNKPLVTERDVTAAHQAEVTLVVSPLTIVTPLARDKAKALHVVIEKE
jgi:hypothetical protein